MNSFSMSEILFEKDFVESSLKSEDRIVDFKIVPTVCQLEDEGLEITTSFIYETVAGRKESLKAYPVHCGSRGGDYMKIVDKNLAAFLELYEELLNTHIDEKSVRYQELRKKYWRDINKLVAENNEVFDLLCKEQEEDILSGTHISSYESYGIECVPSSCLCPKLVDKLKENNLESSILDLTLVIKPELSVKWTHRCYVYLNTNDAKSQLLFSFERDFDAEDPGDEIDPFNFFFRNLYGKLEEDEVMVEKIVTLLKEQNR